MPLKTVGSVKHADEGWILAGEPHVLMRMKQVFAQVSKTYAENLRLSDTPDVARDIEWIMSRYPLKISKADRARLACQVEIFDERVSLVEKFRAGILKPRGFELALPPRSYQTDAAEFLLQRRALLLGDDMGLGKQQPNDVDVLTPQGYRKLGSIRAGDLVIGSGGASTRVLGVYPQGEKPSYRVTLSDGHSVEAGPEHLWTVLYYAGGRRLSAITLTTDQLRQRPAILRVWPNGRETTLSLATTVLYLPMLSAPVLFEQQAALPLPPYALGQLIANGSTNGASATITCRDVDWEHAQRELVRDGLRTGAVHTYGHATRGGVPGVIGKLRALGLSALSKHKRIPGQYLTAEPHERIRLLQGLMDSDGHASATNNRISYYTASPGLASDVVRLVQELGGVARLARYERAEKGVEWVVRIKMPRGIKPFLLPRKAGRYRPGPRALPARSVVSVEYVREVQSTCIAVAAEDALYVTENAILTHNTITAICAIAQPETRPALVVAPRTLQRQWVRQLNRFVPELNVHLLKARSTYDLTRAGVFPDVIVSTYSKLVGWADTLRGVIRLLVLDEIQDLRNGTGTQKGEAVKFISDQAHYRLGMSATPINNLGAEFWKIFQFLFPGALGTWSEFLIEWCGALDSRGRSALREPKIFGDYIRKNGMMIRRTRAEVGRELPPLTRIVHAIDCDEKPLKNIENAAMRLARMIVDRTAAPKDEMRIRGEFSYMMRHATGVAKAPYVAEFVKLLLESEKKVLLYGWHYDVYAIWKARLEKDHQVRMFVGETTDAQRLKAEEDFTKGDAQVLIMSLRAAAGLDGLQHVCRTVVFGELDHSPGVHEQDICRLFRDGQPDPVAAYFLLAEDGSDPVLADMLQIKRAQIEGVRNPSLDVIESLEADGSRIRKMAEAFLKKERKLNKRKSA